MLEDNPPDEPVSDDDHAWNDGRLFGPDIRRLFRRVVDDRCSGGPLPAGSELLSDPVFGPFTDDSDFLSFFYNEFMHQETCYPHTAKAVPLIVVLATDDRVPAIHRMQLVRFLFSMATLADKHVAESWPDPWPHADRASETAAKQAVAEHLSDLLSRWGVECAAVRLHLAALAVTFPTPRTHAALEARLAGLHAQFPKGTHTGDLVRFMLAMATTEEAVILDAVEDFTDTYWRGTYHAVPVSARAMHLLHQMLLLVFIDIRRAALR